MRCDDVFELYLWSFPKCAVMLVSKVLVYVCFFWILILTSFGVRKGSDNHEDLETSQMWCDAVFWSVLGILLFFLQCFKLLLYYDFLSQVWCQPTVWFLKEFVLLVFLFVFLDINIVFGVRKGSENHEDVETWCGDVFWIFLVYFYIYGCLQCFKILLHLWLFLKCVLVCRGFKKYFFLVCFLGY